jgi:hypothetical protein
MDLDHGARRLRLAAARGHQTAHGGVVEPHGDDRGVFRQTQSLLLVRGAIGLEGIHLLGQRKAPENLVQDLVAVVEQDAAARDLGIDLPRRAARTGEGAVRRDQEDAPESALRDQVASGDDAGLESSGIAPTA